MNERRLSVIMGTVGPELERGIGELHQAYAGAPQHFASRFTAGEELCQEAVSRTAHMTDLKEFADMNRVYAEYFQDAPPGRTTVEVAALPGGAHIEIAIVAAV